MPSHVDASILYVPIMPETSKMDAAMERVGQDATESFGKGSAGIGDKIHESVTKTKDKLKDVFHRSGSDAADSMADGVKQNSKKVEDAIGNAGEKATSRFRETAKGLGKQLVDAIGPDTQKLLGDKLEETVGGALEGVLGDKAGVGAKFARSVADWGFDELKQKLGGVKDAANETRQAFADFSSGDVSGGISKLVDSAEKLGVEVKDLPEPLQEVVGQAGEAVGKFDEIKESVHDFADTFSGLPGKIGGVAAKIGELAGPISMLASAIWTLRDQEKAGLFDKTTPDGKTDWWKISAGVLGTWAEDKYNRIFHGHGIPGSEAPSPPLNTFADVPPSERFLGGDHDDNTLGVGGGKSNDVIGSDADAYDVLSSGNPLPSAPAPSTPAVETPAPAPTHDIPPSSIVGGGQSSSYSSPKDLNAGASRIANLYRVAQALQGTPYSQALRNDCSGMVSKLATAALGMNPSVEFSTVNEGDWLFSHGFQPGMGPEGSLRIGWYDHGGGNAGHTAATLPGGEHAESGGAHGDFTVGPSAAGADDPEFDHHAWLPMDGSANGLPRGRQHDPLYVTQVDANGNPAKDSTENQAQQFGSGLLDGIAQSVGLDGSVFKTFGGSSNPMNFGVTKMATSLLNWGLGGGGSARAGGDGAANPVIPGLGALIPGAAIPGAVVSTPQGAQPGAGGNTINIHGDVQPFNPTINGGQGETPDLKNIYNGFAGRSAPMVVPNGGGPVP